MTQAVALVQNQDEAQKIRAELNLEQWPFWLPTKSRNKIKEKAFRKEITLENGDKATAEVSIIPTVRGMLTTEDQKTYYGLIKLWEENRREDDYVYFSLRKLAKTLGKKWGTRTIETLTDSLWRLYYTQFNWTNSYYDASKRERIETSEGFRILEKHKTIKAERDGHITRAEGYFKFNDFILTNIKNNHSKPVLLNVILYFRSEVAQKIYSLLDTVLAKDIKHYEKKTYELFQDLALEGKMYQHPSGRKQILSKAILELENIPLSNGYTIASITIEKTADGKDYKLVVTRGRTKPRSIATEPRFIEGGSTAHSQAELSPEGHTEPATQPQEPTLPQSEEVAHAEELLTYFNEVFFGVTNPTMPTRSSHRDAATALVARHGLEQCKYIVDFAKAEAAKTNFNIATFGAITNYVDRAVAEHTRHEAERKRAEEYRRREAQQEREREEVERAHQTQDDLARYLYDQLADDERAALTNHYENFLAIEPNWQNAADPSHVAHVMFTGAVKAAVRRHLLAQHNPNATIREA